jgi:uncharacterized protein YifN (PemK superfamily)
MVTNCFLPDSSVIFSYNGLLLSSVYPSGQPYSYPNQHTWIKTHDMQRRSLKRIKHFRERMQNGAVLTTQNFERNTDFENSS